MKHKIQVFKDNNLVEIIHRVVWCEAVGNFTPVYCRYKNKVHLVKSSLSDLSDPFRCNDYNHEDKLFIQIFQ